MVKADFQATKATTDQADDFKLIHGIGPGLEKRLHSSGILTYAQLASMTTDEVISTLGDVIGLTSKRVSEQQWIDQARGLAPDKQVDNAMKPVNSQHYATFMVELLLIEGNEVRRTRAVNVQTKDEQSWAGWDGERLLDFFIQQASLPVRSSSGVFQAAQPERVTVSEQAIEPELKPQISGITGQVQLLELAPHHIGQEVSKRFIPENQPFNIRLAINLTDVDAPPETPIKYSAAVFAKELGTDLRQKIGFSEGMITPTNHLDLDVGAEGLACGIYRTDAIVALFPPDQEPKPGSSPMAMMEGGLLQIY
jgi:hypothetical protein